MDGNIVLEDGTCINSLPPRRRKKAQEAYAPSSFFEEDSSDIKYNKNNTSEEKKKIYSSLDNVNYVPMYEYLDHPADVIIHAKGANLSEAFVNSAYAFFNYMTDLNNIQNVECREITATGHDIYNLLFHFLDELLFLYGSEYFIGKYFDVLEFKQGEEEERKRKEKERKIKREEVLAGEDIGGEGGDTEGENKKEEVEENKNSNNEKWSIKCICYGEIFDRSRHYQGTEIKAITMHEMQVYVGHNRITKFENEEKKNENEEEKEKEKEEEKEEEQQAEEKKEKEVELYVLVDI